MSVVYMGVGITCVGMRMEWLRMQAQMQGASHLATSPACLARLNAEYVRGMQGESPGEMPGCPQGRMQGRSHGNPGMTVREMLGESHLPLITGDSQGHSP